MTYPKIPMYRMQLVRDGGVKNPRLVTCADTAARIAKELTDDAPDEKVIAFFINGANEVIGVQVVAMGAPDHVAFTPAQLLRGAILANARGIIVAHNHPSGCVQLSSTDRATAVQVQRACKAVGLAFLDFIVVSHSTDKFDSTGGYFE